MKRRLLVRYFLELVGLHKRHFMILLAVRHLVSFKSAGGGWDSNPLVSVELAARTLGVLSVRRTAHPHLDLKGYFSQRRNIMIEDKHSNNDAH